MGLVWVAVVVAACVATASYFNGLNGNFVFDDLPAVVQVGVF